MSHVQNPRDCTYTINCARFQTTVSARAKGTKGVNRTKVRAIVLGMKKQLLFSVCVFTFVCVCKT